MVDASLTMGRGPTGSTGLDHAAWAIESVALNAASAMRRAGLLVHGSRPRLTVEPVHPDELNPHVVHRADVHGSFDAARAVEAAAELLVAGAGPGPRRIVLVTDGRRFPGDTDGIEAMLRRRNVGLDVFVTGGGGVPSPARRLAYACDGRATTDPAELAASIGRCAGASITFHPLPRPEPMRQGEEAFEIVIESLEEERP